MWFVSLKYFTNLSISVWETDSPAEDRTSIAALEKSNLFQSSKSKGLIEGINEGLGAEKLDGKNSISLFLNGVTLDSSFDGHLRVLLAFIGV